MKEVSGNVVFAEKQSIVSSATMKNDKTNLRNKSIKSVFRFVFLGVIK